MSRQSSSTGQVHPAVALALGAIAVAGLVVAIVVSRPNAAPNDPAPSAPTSPSPTIQAASPRPTSTPVPVRPSSPADPDPAVVHIPLDIADEHDVVVSLQDPGGHVRDARSGHAGDGMSVRWHDADVVQTGPDTIRVTWVGLPVDDRVDVNVDVERDGAAVSIRIAQAAPPANSDAIGFDRVLVLSFDQPIDSGSVSTRVLDRSYVLDRGAD
jgi:hypothetical protein